MHNVELAPGVYAVGAVDWDQRDFHGYVTPRGVTYNAYLIVDDKICLIDNVKAPFADELLARISQIVDPARLDYVVTNHVEPDHSGSLPVIMDKAPHAQVILTAAGQQEVVKHFGHQYDFRAIKEGDSVSLGRRTLRFIPLPMLHWPDSMCTYLVEDGILFSNDAFGQHICTNLRFDDENNLADVLYEAGKYFANILMPYSRLVPKALEKAGSLDIRMIAPSHGVIWRSHISTILEKYRRWATGEAADRVLVIYDSMWGGTEAMARQILEGITAAGMPAKLIRIPASDRSATVAEILDAKGLLFGSPTLNSGMLPTMGTMLVYLKGLKPQHKLAAAFGTYGWAGGAQKDMEELMRAAGMTVEPGLNVKWRPSPEELDQCFSFGQAFANKIRER